MAATNRSKARFGYRCRRVGPDKVGRSSADDAFFLVWLRRLLQMVDPKPRSSGSQSILNSEDLSKLRSACWAAGESRSEILGDDDAIEQRAVHL